MDVGVNVQHVRKDIHVVRVVGSVKRGNVVQIAVIRNVEIMDVEKVVIVVKVVKYV